MVTETWIESPIWNDYYLIKRSSPGRVQLVKSDSGFVQADGSISHLDLYDYLHLSPQGQRKVFEPVHDLLVQLLAESQS